MRCVQVEVCVGERAAGMCVRTATWGALGGRASENVGGEAETVDGRVIMGPTGGVTGFCT